MVKEGLNGITSAGFLFSGPGGLYPHGGILIGSPKVLHWVPLSTDPLVKEDVDTHLI